MPGENMKTLQPLHHMLPYTWLSLVFLDLQQLSVVIRNMYPNVLGAFLQIANHGVGIERLITTTRIWRSPDYI